ncbi:hypothetical protein A7Q10_06580 [Methylacidiphilum caldifontis]|uniref:Uncharacterized protein n=1 Tax=Methylacidiphilum caldifontis TaxID=2795386 RepID=A0A4Y8PGF8_9BACT|nr:hypothetical protein A7Q10_06580 [Methylacidiphilum caldifontis]
MNFWIGWAKIPKPRGKGRAENKGTVGMDLGVAAQATLLTGETLLGPKDEHGLAQASAQALVPSFVQLGEGVYKADIALRSHRQTSDRRPCTSLYPASAGDSTPSPSRC